MAIRVKTAADLAVMDRSEMHRWVLDYVDPVEGGTYRHYGCDCGAAQTRFTAYGETVSRRTHYRYGGGGHD